MDVKEFFTGLGETVLEPTLSYVTDYFHKESPTFAKVEDKIETAYITNLLKSPIVWVIGFIIIYFVVKGINKR